MIDPNELATLYYFGELPYWRLPEIAVTALEEGFDGPSLRMLAGLLNPVESDIHSEDVDSAFKEMGVAAPISRDVARLSLAAKSAMKAVRGDSNVFDEATHIRIRLCELKEPPSELRRIVALSKESSRAHSEKWNQLEKELTEAMNEFLRGRE